MFLLSLVGYFTHAQERTWNIWENPQEGEKIHVDLYMSTSDTYSLLFVGRYLGDIVGKFPVRFRVLNILYHPEHQLDFDDDWGDESIFGCKLSAKALEAAGYLGGKAAYLGMLDRVLGYVQLNGSPSMKREYYMKMAGELGLNTDGFSRMLDSKLVEDILQGDQKSYPLAYAQASPTFIIRHRNGTIYRVGYMRIGALKKLFGFLAHEQNKNPYLDDDVQGPVLLLESFFHRFWKGNQNLVAI